MTLTRRKFLQICAGSVAAAGASSILTPQVVQALKQEAEDLLKAYREANRNKKAVWKLREKRRVEHETVVARRGDEAAGDLAAARLTEEKRLRQGEA